MPQSKIDAAYKVGEEEAPTETPTVEESEESEEETKDETSEEAGESEEEKGKGEPDPENQEADPAKEEESEDPEEEQERRPTRSERRIHQLTHKLQQTSQNGQVDPADEETPQNPGSVLPWQEGQAPAVTPEQLQTAIAEGVRSELEAREVAAAERVKAQEWLDDYEGAVKAHPELDPKSQSYNQKLDDLLTALLSNPDGTPRYEMKVSAALAQVKESLAVAEKKGAAKASVKLAQQVEEGALTPGSADDEAETYTEDDLKSLRINNPRKYNQLVKEGKI